MLQNYKKILVALVASEERTHECMDTVTLIINLQKFKSFEYISPIRRVRYVVALNVQLSAGILLRTYTLSGYSLFM